MAFQRVPDTAIVETIYQQNSKIIEMTFYAEFSGGYSQGDLNTLAANVDNRVGSSFLPIQTIDATYLRTEVRGLNSINDMAALNVINAGAGANTIEGFPNQVTYAVQRNAGLTGRSARGRVFWIGLAKNDVGPNENFLNSIDAIAIVLAVENMRVSLDLSGWNAVIVSRVTGGAPRAEGVTFNWINTLAVDERVDTLRGRLP